MIDCLCSHKAFLLHVSFLMSLSLGASAQKTTFSGKVLDFDSKAPIAGVTVSMLGKSLATVTDKQGRFSFSLEVDSYTLVFSSVEYRTTNVPIYILDQQSITVELKRRLPTELPEVTIEARAKDANVSDAKMSTVTINLAQIRKTPIVFGEADLLKALTLETGVATIGEGAGGFSVRGGNADQNLILLDGAPLFNTSHLLGFFSTISPESVQDFTLYKGAIPASFGGRLSSLIALNIRPGNTDTLHYGGNISPVSIHLFGEGPLVKKKLTFSADGRLAFPRLLMDQFPGSVANSNAFFYDGVAKLVYRFSEKNQVGLSFYRSYDLFQFPGDTSYTWRSEVVALNGRSEISSRLGLYYNANISYYGSDINGLEPSYQFRLRSTIETHELKASLHYQANEQIYMEGGYDFIRYSVGPGDIKPTGSGSQINNSSLRQEYGDETAAYLLERWNISRSSTLELGVRYSEFLYLGPNTIYQYQAGLPQSKETLSDSLIYPKGKTIQSYGGWEPRALLKVGLDDETSLKFSYIRTRQYIQLISNTIAITPIDYWKLCDPDIKPAVADQVAAGLFRNFRNDEIETSLEGFYKQSSNLLDYKNGASLSMNRYIDADLLPANGKAYGLEVNVRKNKGKLTGHLGYTWSRSLMADVTQFASEQVNGGAYYPSAYDRPFNLSLSADFKLGQGWDVGCNFVYITGRPATYPDGTYVINNTVVVNYSVRNEDKLPDYDRLDISFSHDSRRFADQKKYCIINFSLYNVYARQNPYSVYFQRQGNVLVANELSVLGTIIPSMTISYYF
jgi:hypothetical protein